MAVCVLHISTSTNLSPVYIKIYLFRSLIIYIRLVNEDACLNAQCV
jgi:hypothetical protein